MRSQTGPTLWLTGCLLLVAGCGASTPPAAPVGSTEPAMTAAPAPTAGLSVATPATASTVEATVLSPSGGAHVVTVTTGSPTGPLSLRWPADTSVRIGEIIEVARQAETDVVTQEGAPIEPNEPYLTGPIGVLRRSDGAQPCRTAKSCWQWTAVTSGATDLWQQGPGGLVCSGAHTATTTCAAVAAGGRYTHVTVDADPARGVLVATAGTGTAAAHVEPGAVLVVQLDIPGVTFNTDPAITAGWQAPTVTGGGLHAIGNPYPTVCFGDKACVAWAVDRIDAPVTIDILSALACSGPPCDGSHQETRHFTLTLT